MPKIVDHERRRQEYLDALWRVVDSAGAAGISVRAVAQEAGTSKSSLAHYFGSEANLLAAAVAQHVESVTAEVEQLSTLDLDLDTAVDIVMLTIPTTALKRRRSQVWLLLLTQQRDPELQRVLDELNTALEDGLTGLLASMDSRGLLGAGREPSVEVQRLLALIDGLSLQIINDPDEQASIRTVVRRHLQDLSTSA